MLDRLRAAVQAADQAFGPDDHRTLAARLDLGRGFRQRCRDHEAYAELAALADACARALGPEHPFTLTVHHEVALSCYHLHLLQVEPEPGRLPEAVRRLEEVAVTRERLMGPAHPDTLAVWTNLAAAYATAERFAESHALDKRLLAGWTQALAGRERDLGPDAPDTQFARVRLAEISSSDDSRALWHQVMTSWGRLAAKRSTTLGPAHPDTIDARGWHAYSHRALGRYDDEVRLVEEIAAELLDLLGSADPRTLHAQVQLASRYFEGNYDGAAAVELGERIIEEACRVLGPEHQDLRVVRAVLMLSYHVAGRTDEVAALAARYPMPDDEDGL
ncbi:tetratricopeptide repeat protein [Dactylosporangium sp. McL0621]|uniref:tetratricopeptide repeat protein n=1 Tax=Dactylosporangium sp. McL0621 TaxID=3415678 RepID=UPI003CEA5E07